MNDKTRRHQEMLKKFKKLVNVTDDDIAGTMTDPLGKCLRVVLKDGTDIMIHFPAGGKTCQSKK